MLVGNKGVELEFAVFEIGIFWETGTNYSLVVFRVEGTRVFF